jgi:hypothetical protein
MTSRRVILGKYNDGVSYGMRVSLSGFDALTEDGSSGVISFDSNWDDLAYVHQIGIVSGPLPSVSIANPGGYVPFVEVRQIQGSLISDDSTGLPATAGGYGMAAYYSSTDPAALVLGLPLTAPMQAIYLVYKIPVSIG